MLKQLLILIIPFAFLHSNVLAQYSEKGIASFYADRFDGRKTASGEIFRNSKLTAAHKKLPFGTQLKVTNLKNGKSVTVRINDRGPYAHGRIIDLSKKAAKQIDMIDDGLAEVRIEEITNRGESNELINPPVSESNTSSVISIWETPRTVSGYGVQLASYEEKESALRFGKEIHKKGVELPLIKLYQERGKTYYRVLAGVFDTEEKAEAYRKKLKKQGYKGFVKTY